MTMRGGPWWDCPRSVPISPTSRPRAQNVRVERAKAAGKLLADRAKAIGVEAVVFDRGGYQYHGRVKAFAEGAREGGLKF